MDRRRALRILGGAAAGWPAARHALAQPEPPRGAPNILFVMTDDQRRDAMSAYGNPILKTPHMDRLAAGGVRFDLAFVTNALCAPSRASILTGLYSHAHGVITNGDARAFADQPGLSEATPTFPALLRRAGYFTALVGKWHLRSEPTGFDQWVIFPGQGAYQDPEMVANGVRLKLRGHADDVVGDQALTFLRERPKDRPFCLLYQFKSPHRSWMPAARFESAFADVPIPIPRTFEDRLQGRPEALRQAEMAIADMPDFRDRGVPESLSREERKRKNLEALVKNYYRVLLSVDENLGRVLDYLDKEGLVKSTVVVYTSDNGFFLGEHGLFDKRLMYEPSIRVPLLVRFPRRARAGLADRTHMVLNVDVAPTLLELAGVHAPAGLHGRSFVPLLEGKEAPWRDAILYEYYEYPAEHCVRKNRGVRTDRYKLIHFYEQPEEWELYDLATDPDETVNLAPRKDQAARVRELKAKLEELRRAVGDADPPGPPPVSPPCRPAPDPPRTGASSRSGRCVG
jgi:arylsulfatase A-like enzyme